MYGRGRWPAGARQMGTPKVSHRPPRGGGDQGGPRGETASESGGKGGRNERWRGGVTLGEEKENQREREE